MLALRKPTLLVLTNGGPLAIDALVRTTRHPSLPPGPAAIVEAFNPNTNGATALAKLIFGHECRWGKLPYLLSSSRQILKVIHLTEILHIFIKRAFA